MPGVCSRVMTYRFACALVGLVAVVSGAAGQADSGGPPDRFSTLSEAQLDSLYGPLVYLMQPDERGIYPELPVSGKRDFLRHFWAQRDPTPGKPKNTAEETFNARIAEVNRKFREGGASEVPGWRTDRGRVYLEYGPPDIVLSRRGPGVTPPFEVWKYSRGKVRHKYCFVDLTRFGNYVLIFSNDPREPSRPDWETLLGGDAYEDAVRF